MSNGCEHKKRKKYKKHKKRIFLEFHERINPLILEFKLIFVSGVIDEIFFCSTKIPRTITENQKSISGGVNSVDKLNFVLISTR